MTHQTKTARTGVAMSRRNVDPRIDPILAAGDRVTLLVTHRSVATAGATQIAKLQRTMADSFAPATIQAKIDNVPAAVATCNISK